jgi:hypothetical protein
MGADPNLYSQATGAALRNLYVDVSSVLLHPLPCPELRRHAPILEVHRGYVGLPVADLGLMMMR